MDTFRPNPYTRWGAAVLRTREAAHVVLERAVHPTRDQLLGVAALGVGSLIALIGLLQAMDTPRTRPLLGIFEAEADDED